MNYVFWVFIVIILLDIWWVARRWFVSIGKSISDKHDEMIDILHGNMYDEIIRDGNISKRTMEEFLNYYNKNIKEM